MKRDQQEDKGKGAPRQRLKTAPPSREAWAALQHNLGTALEDLEEDEFLILTSKAEHYFVQFAGQGEHGMRAEAVSNTFVEPDAQLSDSARQEMVRLGWNPPTYVPAEGTAQPKEGSPNYYIDAETPVPHARLAALAVKTLRRIYRIRHPEELMYNAFSKDKASIRFPLLKIQREATTSADCPSAAPIRSQAPLGATKDPSRVPTFVLPNGQPISAEQVEADLRGRVARCEEELDGARLQLARYYSAVGRYDEARACAERSVDGSQDPKKRAASCLRLGQLLEQQDRYAEAEAMDARGLEIPSAAAEVRYFLQKNRGYCLNQLGRHAEAEVHCRAAIAVNPPRHNAHKNLGLALAGQGRLAEAARCLLEADSRCPEDGRARRHLAQLLAENPELLETDPALATSCRGRGIPPGRVGSA